MCNHVFNITIDDDGVAFLKHHHGKNPINILLEFPWHEAKQLRIVLWGVDFQERLFQLRANLVAVCHHLSYSTSLKNVRVDVFDDSHHLAFWSDDLSRFTDEDETHPVRDSYDGPIQNRSAEAVYRPYAKGYFEFWARIADMPTNSNTILPYASDMSLFCSR